MRKFILAVFLLGLVGVRSQAADDFLGYSIVPAFTNVVFASPVAIVSPPGETNRLFIVEKAGSIVVITNLAAPNRTVFMSLSAHLDSSGECGVLGLAFHPDYSSNGYFYVFYTPAGANGTRYDRVSRFSTNPTNTNAGVATSEQVLISQVDLASNHQGADIHFGPDGYLYIPLGDEGGANDQYGNSQHIANNFFSGILRIDVDKRPGNLTPNPHPAATTNYLVPADNPFVGATSFNGRVVDPSKVRTEFWAVGLRNPWRITFDEETGLLYCADVGQNAREEIDIIVKGGNYGWNFREGTIRGPNPSMPPVAFSGIDPIFDYAHGSGTNHGECIIGGVVYHGQNLSQLAGSYIFADFVNGNVWSLNYTGTTPVTPALIAHEIGICAFGTDPRDGEVLIASYAGNSIRKLILTPDQLPTVRLLSPTSIRVTNSPVTFTGSASDDVQVTQVVFQINGGDFQPATGTSNWTFTTDLLPGTNIVVIKSMDDAGHESLPLTLTRYCVINDTLTVQVNGIGTTTPNLSGKLLELTKSYQTKALPGTGFVFTNWTGGVTSGTPLLTFTMQSNLVIEPNFIPNPFPTVHGIYNGLFIPSANIGSDNAGFITFNLSSAGTYTGTLLVDGMTNRFSGAFSLSGTSSATVVRFGKSTLHLTLQLDLSTANDALQGTVTDGSWSADLLAFRRTYTTANPATKWVGRYTSLLPPDTNGPPDLQGFGYAIGTIGLTGILQVNGALGDGTTIIQSISVSKDGRCPIYIPLYPGLVRLTNNSFAATKPDHEGFLLGWLFVSNAPNAIMTGDFYWVKKSSTNQFWPNGFTNHLAAIGSAFHPPAVGARVMNFTNYSATFFGNALASNLVASLQLASDNKLTADAPNAISLVMQINPMNGLVTGSFTDTSGSTEKLKGALLQQQNYGAGVFTGTNFPGGFKLEAE
ncbi:MAG: PQQ-dependent sugar dehydrogenase [Limisphaerales bacterium]